jgi:hypothetical protein
MKCHSLRDAIVELAREGIAGPGTRAAVDSHVEDCRSCAALLVRERQLSQGLRALAAATSSDGSSAALGPRLLEAFAERQSAREAAQEVNVAPVLSHSGWSRWLGAAAALAMVVGAMAWWVSARSGPAPESSTSTTAVRADAPTPRPAPAPVVAPTADRQAATPVAAGRPRAARARKAPVSPVVRPVGFVALPGAAGLPDFESGQIIRMEIPLTSLPTYGLEILPDAQGSPVKADLLVGQDGQARAIRLVTTSALR